ncbi:hypothetical protein [Natribacillus halophilus]|uniref:Nuclear transport factor 2 family protein n=1 Tax=Natribacillus halophilus TaxID=549003 RepID=A0A1G8RP98_9BACI|nr:hypothetical protein [Natribacillus halophilus]SDJ18797.1 hypothetical protein SAMN04488123_11942 [Natribacillus halophilus]
MEKSISLCILFLFTVLALPATAQSDNQAGEEAQIQKPRPLVEDVFTGEKDDLVQSLKAIQEWTQHFLSDNEGDIDTETGAHMVEDLQDYYSEDMALEIYNQFHRPHLMEPDDFNDYIEVDSLLHRDIDSVEVAAKNDGAIVHMKTSSVEDGAGNRAYFEETFALNYDSDREVYVISGMKSEQTK